ncbi:MAG TPA: hypothetical protein V6C78_16535 [Crinalium sp.]
MGFADELTALRLTEQQNSPRQVSMAIAPTQGIPNSIAIVAVESNRIRMFREISLPGTWMTIIHLGIQQCRIVTV